MSSSVSPESGAPENEDYAAVERAARLIIERGLQAIDQKEVNRISDEAVVKLLTAALKLYVRKAGGSEPAFGPFVEREGAAVSAAEAVTVATEILRSLQMGAMELGLWSRRYPENYHARQAAPAATSAPRQEGRDPS